MCNRVAPQTWRFPRVPLFLGSSTWGGRRGSGVSVWNGCEWSFWWGRCEETMPDRDLEGDPRPFGYAALGASCACFATDSRGPSALARSDPPVLDRKSTRLNSSHL